MLESSEFSRTVRSATKSFSTGGRIIRAAALFLISATAVGAAAPAVAAPAQWTQGISLAAAALGLAVSTRRPRGNAKAKPDGALLALAGDFVARLGADGRVTAIEGEGWSEWAAESGELVGYGLSQRLHVDDRARLLGELRHVAADGRARSVSVKLRRRNAADGFEPVEIRIARGGGAGGLIAAIRRNGALAELEAARQEARVERTLKDRLLANMSHELRTPLNAILGFSEILGDASLSPADSLKRLEYARIIHASAEHLLGVVNLVLDMSRIEAGKFAISPEPLELEPLIRECCDMLRLRAGDGQVELVAPKLPEGLEIVADKAACRQILVNLISNAVKFTPPNGRVAVEVAVDAREARISVTDTGIGVKPDDLPRLGDPFFQVKSGYDRSFEGAGLGLSLVRGLVGLHDGSILLESAYGIGTRVTICLPMTARPATRRGGPARLETKSCVTLPGAAEEEKRIA